jgi:hypothetical protein
VPPRASRDPKAGSRRRAADTSPPLASLISRSYPKPRQSPDSASILLTAGPPTLLQRSVIAVAGGVDEALCSLLGARLLPWSVGEPRFCGVSWRLTVALVGGAVEVLWKLLASSRCCGRRGDRGCAESAGLMYCSGRQGSRGAVYSLGAQRFLWPVGQARCQFSRFT